MSDIREMRDHLNGLLHERVEPLARYLYPQGKKIGHSWRVGSFDINLNNGFWGDFDGATEGMSRNLLDLWCHATQSDFKTAVVEITRWLGMSEQEWQPRPASGYQKPEKQKHLVLPLLEKPRESELRQLSTLRAIDIEPLEIAVRKGFLWTYTDLVEEARAWLLTDSARKSAIARRLDGLAWQAPWAKGAKSKTLKGSCGHWPIGIREAQSCSAIGLVEGSPDFLALIAHALVRKMENQVAPVCMAGAQMSIPDKTLPFFAGKRVRIFVDADEAGMRAAKRWASQLMAAGASCGGYTFKGATQHDERPVKDLNDLLRISDQSRKANAKALEELLNF